MIRLPESAGDARTRTRQPDGEVQVLSAADLPQAAAASAEWRRNLTSLIGRLVFVQHPKWQGVGVLRHVGEFTITIVTTRDERTHLLRIASLDRVVLYQETSHHDDGKHKSVPPA